MDRQSQLIRQPAAALEHLPVLGGARRPDGTWPEIVCPSDGRPVIPDDGKMVCEFGHRWRIDRGIPRMLSAGGNYADAFGLQWKTYRSTQLDSRTGTTLSRDRARRCLGEECWQSLHSTRHFHVLEVGCGAGRFTEVLLSTGA